MSSEYYQYKIYNAKNATSTVFFFPAGFTQMWLYGLTVRQLNKRGFKVVGFNIKWRKAIQEFDIDGFITFMNQMNDVVTEIQTKTKDNQKYSVFGISFGSLIALYVAKRHKNISSLVLMVPYGKFSHLLMSHEPSKPFKEMLLANGLDTEEKIHLRMLPIESQTNLDTLKNRKIVNYTALNDRIVDDGKEFAEALRKNVPTSVLYETQYGHLWGSVVSILRKSKWLPILED